MNQPQGIVLLYFPFLSFNVCVANYFELFKISLISSFFFLKFVCFFMFLCFLGLFFLLSIFDCNEKKISPQPMLILTFSSVLFSFEPNFGAKKIYTRCTSSSSGQFPFLVIRETLISTVVERRRWSLLKH